MRECAATHDPAQDGERKLGGHLLACGSRTMALHDMRNFVGHHPGQFGLVIGSLNRAQIYVNRSARKSEGVDLFLIDDMKAVRPLLAGSMRRQLSSEALYVLCDRI